MQADMWKIYKMWRFLEGEILRDTINSFEFVTSLWNVHINALNRNIVFRQERTSEIKTWYCD